MSSLNREFYLELHAWPKRIVRASSSHSTSFYFSTSSVPLLSSISFRDRGDRSFSFEYFLLEDLYQVYRKAATAAAPKIRSNEERSRDNDLNVTRPTCHGHERARLPPIFVRWPIQSRFSKGPALQGAPSPFWTDTTATRLDEPRRLNPNTTNVNLSPSHAPLRRWGRGIARLKEKYIADPSGNALRSRYKSRR